MTLPRAELGLGTARFGLDKAAVDPRERVGEDAVRAILDTAAVNRLSLVDTSAGWGDAERVLGRSWPFPSPFRVVTKVLPAAQGLDRVEARARRSLELMGLPRAHALMVERAEDLLGPEGRALWARLERLKGEGLFQKIGISATPAEEPLLLARRFKPDLMQLPGSMLDQRLARSGVLAAVADLGVDIHLRSVFMQGLLFLPREALPQALQGAGPRLSRIRRMLAEAGADPLQAQLAWAQTREEVSAVIVGVTSTAELRAVLAAAAAPTPSLDWSALALEDPGALDAGLSASAPFRLSSAA